jgi:hypothetical protein
MTATTPRERAVNFRGPEVRAILAGIKTQFRRPVKPQPRPVRYGPKHPTQPSGIIGPGQPGQFGDGDYCVWEPPIGPQKGSVIPWSEGYWYRIEPECPYGEPGDRIAVREQFAALKSPGISCQVTESSYVTFMDGSQKFRDNVNYRKLAESPHASAVG